MLTRTVENWRELDRIVIIGVMILALSGLMAIYSATSLQEASALLHNSFSKQVIWLLIGVMAASAVILMPTKTLHDAAYGLYAASIVLLVLVLFIGGGKGAQRWFIFGPVHFQPSELAKIATILALAKFLSSESRDLSRVKNIAIAFSLVALPVVLILKQPDLGTAITTLAILLPVMFWAGLSPFIIFLAVSPLLVVVSAFNFYTFLVAMVLITSVLFLTKRRLPMLIVIFVLNICVGALTPSLWNRLHGYQKTRILIFLGLEQDPRGTGYQVAQSQVAIGSGGFWGKGWTKGTQTKLRFLPEQHTDFIFSVIGEEFGFFGVTIILLVFFTLLWRGFQIAGEVKNKFLALVVAGSVSLIAVHVIINTGMTVGIMPVTGIPLPFLSYGGSSLLTNMILIGLILSASTRKFQY